MRDDVKRRGWFGAVEVKAVGSRASLHQKRENLFAAPP
jgi:hypothetical protein